MAIKIVRPLLISAGFFILVYCILRLFYSPVTSAIVAFVLFILSFVIILFINSRKAVKVMVDKPVRCPFCGREIEAAFINDKLAMNLNCPYCGRELHPTLFRPPAKKR